MQYSEIVGVEPFFDSTVNITEEIENYWKQFITNEKFESNLKEIINVFTSPNTNQHKSIWIQGTYGTGKSHSTSVVKHLLSDNVDEIKDYVDRLSNPQLKAMLLGFRKNERVFPIVLKGTYAIGDTEDLKYTIQMAVTSQLEQAGISLMVKSDFQAVIEMIDDDKFESFWDKMLVTDLKESATTKEGIKESLGKGDRTVLRKIHAALKKSSMIKATPDIKQWLIEVCDELRSLSIADYLVLFWDEFTSLLEITERRSVLNCMQDIAELSKAPRADDKNKSIGVYVFLVTHKSMETTDSYKELKEDEKTMAKARFLGLKYDMQDVTTYHILSNAIRIINEKKYDELVEERITLQSEVAEALKEIVAPMDKSAQTKAMIQKLYPFHPYTAYLATFVSRAIGSAERSIFEFLNDEQRGFKAFINNDIEKSKYITADSVWDFFVDSFSEDRTNNFDAIINKYSMYEPKLKDTTIPELTVFKVILLLNLLNRVTQIDGGDQEKSLVNPSKTNILRVLSGAWNSDLVDKALAKIDERQIVQKGPDDVFEVSLSSMSTEKVQAAKDKLYLKYEDVTNLLDEYPGYKSDITKNISNEGGFNRATDIIFIYGGTNTAISMESKLLKGFSKDYAAKIAIFPFRGETDSKKIKTSEPSIESQKNLIQDLSKKENLKDIVFVVLDTELGQKRFEGIIDNFARATVAKDTKVEDPSSYERKAMKWAEKWKNDINDGPATIIFRGERVNTPTFKTVSNAGLLADIARIFPYGIEKNQLVATASTAWKETYAKKTVEKVCYAADRREIEAFTGVEAPIQYLLKERNGEWIFDENLRYTGQYDQMAPMTVLIKAVDDKIAQLRNMTVVDIGTEFKFLTEPPYGYYKNYVCMAAVALTFRRYIGKMYLADQGSLVTNTVMRDIVNAAFSYWHDKKTDAKLRVRFSTAEEKELVDVIQGIFGVKGDGISETKWEMRETLKTKFKAPLWALKYLGEKGDEFNSVIDSLFVLANATGENITQDDITSLLERLKKQRTSIALILEKTQDASCLIPFINKCLDKVQVKLEDYSNLLSYLKQNLAGEIVFWKEEDVENQILQWCVFQSKPGEGDSITVLDSNGSQEDEDDYSDDGNSVSEDDMDDTEELTDVPEFSPIDMEPIKIGKVHVTIEATTELIDKKKLKIGEAKDILIKLCKEYPVICHEVMRLLGEE